MLRNLIVGIAMGVALTVTPVQAEEKGPILKALQFLILGHGLGVTIQNTDIKYATQQVVIRSIKQYEQHKKIEQFEKSQ